MKSFATLCLLGIGLAVQLDKRGGDNRRGGRCMGDISEDGLQNIKEEVRKGLIDRNVPEDKAE